MPELMMIAAVARNGVIGADNDMPWAVSSDLKHFKKLTVGRPMIMGRRTFQSFPGLLPGRPHIVISRDAGFRAEGAEVVRSLEEALGRANGLARELDVGEVAVIGGGQIYTAAMKHADRLEITEIQADPVGDTRFPDIDSNLWHETGRVQGERTERDSAGFDFVTYRRRG